MISFDEAINGKRLIDLRLNRYVALYKCVNFLSMGAFHGSSLNLWE